MGIKGLNGFLKKVCGADYVKTVPMIEYANKVIAVDASMYVCIFKLRDNYVESCVNLIASLLEASITPVFVFDGHAPDEKSIEREARRLKKQSQYFRIDALERDLDIYHQTGRVSDDLNAINVKTRRGTLISGFFNIKAVTTYVASLRKQMLIVSNADFMTLKRLLDMFGVSYVDAKGEAEITCSKLCKTGTVDAVLSCDSDIVACGVPVILSGIRGANFLEVKLELILTKLALDERELLDFCIMCGTDFNPNMPRVGPVKAYELIKKYKTIDNIPTTVAPNLAMLNHERVREIFNGLAEELTRDNVTLKPINFDSLFRLIVTSKLQISPSSLRKKLTK